MNIEQSTADSGPTLVCEMTADFASQFFVDGHSFRHRPRSNILRSTVSYWCERRDSNLRRLAGAEARCRNPERKRRTSLAIGAKGGTRTLMDCSARS